MVDCLVHPLGGESLKPCTAMTSSTRGAAMTACRDEGPDDCRSWALEKSGSVADSGGHVSFTLD